jgi:glucose-6-phosphate dehydrogenase assembly protein OpcA
MSSVSPERILKDLSQLWVDLSKQAQGEGSTGVLRACTMTLIVVTAETGDAASIGETLAQIMPKHPSRAIVVRTTSSHERTLDARVFAECWVSFGERRHICAEQIEITSSETALAEVPAVVLPLTVSDLPVILWCRSARLFGLAGFDGIAALAGKIVLDSALFPSALIGFDHLQDLLQRGQTAGDLAWTRLTGWREVIARIFQNRGLAALPKVSRVRVRFGQTADGQSSASALYLAAWLMDGLERVGAHPALELQPAAAPDRSVELEAPGLHVELSQCGGRCAEVRINDSVSQTALPEANDRSLMAEELSIPGRDAIFERVLSAARRLALSS